MPRYIDADAFKQKLADKDIFFPALYKNELDEMPTADVAPKSEVDWNSIPVDVSEALKQGAVEKAKTEVAREIFEEFKAKIQAEIANNALLAEYGEEKAEGKVNAYRTAINLLDEITEGKQLSVRQEDELYEKGYNDALKDVEEMLTRGKK